MHCRVIIAIVLLLYVVSYSQVFVGSTAPKARVRLPTIPEHSGMYFKPQNYQPKPLPKAASIPNPANPRLSNNRKAPIPIFRPMSRKPIPHYVPSPPDSRRTTDNWSDAEIIYRST